MRTSIARVGMRKIAWLCLLALPAMAWGRLPPIQEPDNAVFSATQVIVVSHQKEDVYMVEETFLGLLKPKEAVNLPDFKLVTFEKMFGDPEPVAMDERTRILLFLRPDEKDAKRMVVSDYGYAFFYRDVEKVGELRDLANKAVTLRRKWEKACAIADPKLRLEALWPFLRLSLYTCHKMTLAELAKINPLPGDYLAEHLATYGPSERAGLMLLSRAIPSDELHAACIADVDAARNTYDTYLKEHHLDRMALP